MSFAKINDDILRALRPPGTVYYLGLMLAVSACSIGLLAFLNQARTGMGVAGYEHPILWAIYITIGAFGLFFTLCLLFVKNFPAVSITEMKETMQRSDEADPASAWPEPV